MYSVYTNCVTNPLKEALSKQERARKYKKEGNCQQAIALLKETLHIKEQYINQPPFTCFADIVSLHMEIATVYKTFSKKDAKHHFFLAYSISLNHYGINHVLTQRAKCELIDNSTDYEMFPDSAAAA